MLRAEDAEALDDHGEFHPGLVRPAGVPVVAVGADVVDVGVARVVVGRRSRVGQLLLEAPRRRGEHVLGVGDPLAPPDRHELAPGGDELCRAAAAAAEVRVRLVVEDHVERRPVVLERRTPGDDAVVGRRPGLRVRDRRERHLPSARRGLDRQQRDAAVVTRPEHVVRDSLIEALVDPVEPEGAPEILLTLQQLGFAVTELTPEHRRARAEGGGGTCGGGAGRDRGECEDQCQKGTDAPACTDCSEGRSRGMRQDHGRALLPRRLPG